MKIRRVVRVVLFTVLLGRCFCALEAESAVNSRDRSFDPGWRFLRADARGAEVQGFDDTAWRMLDLQHDWSIEDLPPLQKPPLLELPVVDGPWRFQKGDEPAWTARKFDDRGWQRVTLPDTWEHDRITPTTMYMAGSRRHIEVPANCRGKDFELLLGAIDDVDEAWLNGEHIGGTGSFPSDFRSARNVQRRYHVPASLVRGDGSDVLTMRVFDQGGNGGIHERGIRTVHVGPFAPGQSGGGTSTGHVLGGW